MCRLWGAVLLCGAILSAEPRLTKVASKLQHASGSVLTRDGALLVSDAPAGRILRFGTAGQSTAHDGLQGAQGLALDDDGRLYVCESRARRIIRFGRGGKPESLIDSYNGKKLNGPNDLTIAKNGTLYFTDPAFASAQDSREQPHYGVYRATPKREITLLAALKTRPNGIALSSDGKKLYIADSDERTILTLDAATAGSLPNLLIKIPEGVPDGIRLDSRGRLYVAAKDVLVYEAATGKLIETIAVPEKPSSITVADSIIYVTAGTSVYKYDPAEAAH